MGGEEEGNDRSTNGGWREKGWDTHTHTHTHRCFSPRTHGITWTRWTTTQDQSKQERNKKKGRETTTRTIRGKAPMGRWVRMVDGVVVLVPSPPTMRSREQSHGVRAIRKTSPKTRGRIPAIENGETLDRRTSRRSTKTSKTERNHTSHVDRSRWMNSMDLSYSLQDNDGSYANTKPTKERHRRSDPTVSTTTHCRRMRRSIKDSTSTYPMVRQDPSHGNHIRTVAASLPGPRTRGNFRVSHDTRPTREPGIRPLRYMKERRTVRSGNPRNLSHGNP